MHQTTETVISNNKICENFFELIFTWNSLLPSPKPGQFLTIRVSSSYTPLLRRPFAFSMFHSESNRAACIYQVRGNGTEILTGKQQGDSLDIIGPLGNTFTLGRANNSHICVAGGIGLGPMIFLHETLTESKKKSTLLFGCRSSTLIPACDSFNKHSPIICTDDGSAGFHGNVVEYLTSEMPATAPASILYCCGPQPMLKACHQFSAQKHITCQVSVEQTMACGVGVCMGCAVKIKGKEKYARACLEGPVFESEEIEWI